MMNKLVQTKSGVEIYANKEGELLVKGDAKVAISELAIDREDLYLPFEVHNICVVLHTLLSAGKYKKLA